MVKKKYNMDGDSFRGFLQDFDSKDVQFQNGTYVLLINHFPLLYGSLIGTLRIEQLPKNRMIASGDLYASYDPNLFNKWILDDTQRSFPSFDTNDYRIYVQVIEIIGASNKNDRQTHTFERKDTQILCFNLIKYANNPFEPLWRSIKGEFYCELEKKSD